MNPRIVGQLRGDLVVSAPGTSASPDADRISQMNIITPGWMAAYGTGIRAGRDFDERDTLPSPRVMLVNAVVLAAVGALAAWLPAWRASRIDPAEVLRLS